MPTEGALDHFEELLEGLCLNHAFPVKHLYKGCTLMKRFLSSGYKKEDQRKKPEPMADDTEGNDGGFLMLDSSLMIFDGAAAYDSKRCQKLTRREVYTAEPAMPSFLRWSESAITFDRSDHPDSIS